MGNVYLYTYNLFFDKLYEKLRFKTTLLPKHKTNKWRVLGGLTLLLMASFMLNSFLNKDIQQVQKASLIGGLSSSKELSAFPIKIPKLKYGFALDTFQVTIDTIRNNQFLAELLLPHKVDYQKIDQLARNVKDTFAVTKLRANKEYTILTRDTAEGADYFIYEPDVYSYVIYDLKDKLDAKVFYRPVATKIKEAASTIESYLWVTMQQQGFSIDLIDKMEGVFQWSLDFSRIQNGDKFKLIYEEKSIDGKFAGIGKVLGAYFQNYDNKYY